VTARDRAAYLDQVTALLWPAPATVTQATADRRPGQRELIVLPSLRDPRLLVPADRRAGPAALRRYGEPGSTRARLARRGLELALAGGAGRLAARDRLRIGGPPDAAVIDSFLRDQLGHDVLVSLHLGAARANRKPVLQVLTPDARTVAYAKVGATELAGALVRHERAALDQVRAAGLRTLRAPVVRRMGRFGDCDVLILSALPVWAPRRPLPPAALAQAMAEVAGLAGTGPEPLDGYLKSLAGRLAEVPDGPDRAPLARELDRLDPRAALRLGAWHGDWTPWNMAATTEGLLLWDWERFATGVPVGFDALHYWLQAEVTRPARDPAAAAADSVRHAPRLLAPLGVDPGAARLTARLYLAELSVRYLADRQAEAGARLGAPGRWLIPALASAS
jgi:hypothetical protein